VPFVHEVRELVHLRAGEELCLVDDQVVDPVPLGPAAAHQ
jgi:hypothetical protein